MIFRNIIAFTALSILAQGQPLIYESQPIAASWTIEKNVVKASGFDFCLDVANVNPASKTPTATSKISIGKANGDAVNINVTYHKPGKDDAPRVCGFVAPCDIFKLVNANVVEPKLDFIVSIYSSDFTAGVEPLEISSVLQMARFSKEGNVAKILYTITGTAFQSCESFNLNNNGMPIGSTLKSSCSGTTKSESLSLKLNGDSVVLQGITMCVQGNVWETCEGSPAHPASIGAYLSVFEKHTHGGELNLIVDVPTKAAHRGTGGGPDKSFWEFCATVNPCDILAALDPNVKYPDTLNLSALLIAPNVTEWKDGVDTNRVSNFKLGVKKDDDGSYANIISSYPFPMGDVTGFALGPHKTPIKCLPEPSTDLTVAPDDAVPVPEAPTNAPEATTEGATTEGAETSETPESSKKTSSASTWTIYGATAAVLAALLA